MPEHRIDNMLVVGASLAGLRAAQHARKLGYDGRLTLVGAEAHLPYNRPPLSKDFLLGGSTDLEFLSAEALESHGIELRLGTPARLLNTHARTLRVGDDDLDYDGMVITTGADARRLPTSVADPDLRGLHYLRDIDHASSVRQELSSARTMVVIGGGFIGLEIASSALELGVEVVIVEAGPGPMIRALGHELGVRMTNVLGAAGLEVRCGTGVARIHGTSADSVETVCAVKLSDGTVIDADIVCVGVGTQPAVEWLTDSGLELENGIKADENLWTGVPGVYAAGEVVNWFNLAYAQYMRLETWTNAAEQAIGAVTNLLAPSDPKPVRCIPYFWSKQRDTFIQGIGAPGDAEIFTVGDTLEDRKTLVMYRDQDALSMMCGINRPDLVMKFRPLIARRAPWTDAVQLAVKLTGNEPGSVDTLHATDLAGIVTGGGQ